MKRFHDIKEPWGDFVHVKVNSAELLAKELTKAKGGHIWMSSVTDAYYPIEVKYGVTRRILEALVAAPRKNEFTLEILTKSALMNTFKKLGQISQNSHNDIICQFVTW